MSLENRMVSDLYERVSRRRFQHVLQVRDTAMLVYLSYKESYNFPFGLDELSIATLGHDLTKEMSKEFHITYLTEEDMQHLNDDNEPIWHGFSAANYVKTKYDIADDFILEAIRYHTTGNAGLSDLAKIVFVSDYVEPGRPKDMKDLLDLIPEKTLDEMCLIILDRSMKDLKETNREINELSLIFKKELEENIK